MTPARPVAAEYWLWAEDVTATDLVFAFFILNHGEPRSESEAAAAIGISVDEMKRRFLCDGCGTDWELSVYLRRGWNAERDESMMGYMVWPAAVSRQAAQTLPIVIIEAPPYPK